MTWLVNLYTGSRNSKAGDGDPAAVDMAYPVTGTEVDDDYTKLETETWIVEMNLMDSMKNQEVNIGTNQTIHIMAAQSGLTVNAVMFTEREG